MKMTRSNVFVALSMLVCLGIVPIANAKGSAAIRVLQTKLASLDLEPAFELSEQDADELVSILLMPDLFKENLNCENKFTDILPDIRPYEESGLEADFNDDKLTVSTAAIGLIDQDNEVMVTVELDDQCPNIFIEFRSSIDNHQIYDFSVGLTRKGKKMIKPFYKKIEATYGNY